jgi:hypothetical protein
VLVVTGEQAPRLLVDHHQARGVRSPDFYVGVVDPIAGVEIKVIAPDED